MIIRNRKTGEVKEISDNEASNYGVTPKNPSGGIDSAYSLLKSSALRSNPLTAALSGNITNKDVGSIPGSLATLADIGKYSVFPAAARSNPLMAALSGTIWGLGASAPEIAKSFNPQTPGYQYGGGIFNPKNPQASTLQPTEWQKKFMQGFLTGSGGEALGIAGQKILGPVLSKVGLGTPSTMKEGIEDVTKQYGTEIGEGLRKLPKNSIDVTDPLTKLLEYRAKIEKGGDKMALKKIDEVIFTLTKQGKGNKIINPNIGGGTVLNPETAQALKTRFNADIFGEAGKEIAKRGQRGIAEKTAKKITASELSRLIKDELIKNNMPEVLKSISGYESGSLMGKSLERPFASSLGQLPALIAAMGFLTGNPLIGYAGTGTAASSMPYTKIILQSLLGNTLKYGQIPAKILVNSLINTGSEQ